ncbi:MAG: tRNA 2-thiouridine(34) synthase MnmA [bacterium]
MKNIKSINKSISTKGKKVYPGQGRRVFVGLSGGVDSAVAAALLKRDGYDVTGVFIKTWQPEFLPCTWREERRDAMRIALALDIPFLFFDFEEEYKKGVAEKMIEEYRRGRTPNPDVLCNREVKFGAFWKKAKEMGADYIATGHYARIFSRPLFSKKSSDIPAGHGQTFIQKEVAQLLIGRDSDKDQSYFLWTLTQEDLAHTLFPIGHLEKREVRRLAKNPPAGGYLPVAEKKDSQGICFIGEVSMEEFLSHYISTEQGRVLNTQGETIGTHRGALLYTIGERHGFEVIKKNSDDGAYYVVAKDMNQNTITVSNKKEEIENMSPTKIALKGLNLLSKFADDSLQLTARIRYRGEKLEIKSLKSEGGVWIVEFMQPVRGLSLGQSIVFYLPDDSGAGRGDICLGGAVMDEVME